MTELLRQWILGVTCAAMIAAMVQAFARKGGTGKATQLTAGLLVLLAAARPLAGLSAFDVSGALQDLQSRQETRADELTEENDRMMKALIEGKTEAYILDKAEEMGIDCGVFVTYARDESGAFAPARVTLAGALTAEEQRRLAGQITADLGIAGENIVFKEKVG